MDSRNVFIGTFVPNIYRMFRTKTVAIQAIIVAGTDNRKKNEKYSTFFLTSTICLH